MAGKDMTVRSPQEDRGGSRTKKAKTFPEKLMEAMVMYGDEDVVAWLPDGKSFVVVKPDEFVARVLNSVFKQAKYTSFVRKLHRWGFVRLTSGTGTDCFHHPLFNRNRRDLASKISVAAAAGKPKSEKAPPSLAGVERFAHLKKTAAIAMAHVAVQEQIKELEKGTHRKASPTFGLDASKPEPVPALMSRMGTALDKLGIAAGFADPTTTTLNASLSSGILVASSRLSGDAPTSEKSADRGSSSTDVSPSQNFHTERAEL